jgi:hypothetical protein
MHVLAEFRCGKEQPVRFRILGPLGVIGATGQLSFAPRRRIVLSILLLEPNRVAGGIVTRPPGYSIRCVVRKLDLMAFDYPVAGARRGLARHRLDDARTPYVTRCGCGAAPPRWRESVARSSSPSALSWSNGG